MATLRNTQLNKEPEGRTVAYLVFQLSGSYYAVSVSDVREIITSIEISAVPGSPKYLAGVANLRGRVLPIIDLKRKFSFDSQSTNTRECFIVLTTPSEEGPLEFAIRVDNVHEVIKIFEEQVDLAPAMTSFANQLVFDGVAHTPHGVRMILDTKSLVSQLQQDIRSIQNSGTAQSNCPDGSEFGPEA
ncbi:MAG: chemotaxis protein CheW [Pirellulales bacterium]